MFRRSHSIMCSGWGALVAVPDHRGSRLHIVDADRTTSIILLIRGDSCQDARTHHPSPFATSESRNATLPPSFYRAAHGQPSAALVGREISSANSCETRLDATAGSCQAARRGISRAGLARARSSTPITPGRHHAAAGGVHAAGQY
jgi:hypothetical protein